MNIQPHDPALSKDLELLGLQWPAIKPTSFTQYHILTESITSIFDDLHKRFDLPSTQIKSAFATLIQERASPRSVATINVQEQFTNTKLKDAPDRAFLSILRLWTMLDIQLEVPRYSLGIPVWHENEPIIDATNRFFDQKAQSFEVLDVPATIDQELTAARLAENYGIQIVPTGNLAEHLSINWNRRKRILRVFEHKVWVLNHLTFPDTSPIPSDVLEELMGTFNLLFPMFDPPTESLLEKLGMTESFYALGLCERDRSLNWNDYKYWRKDILNLNGVLGEAPQGARQLLRVDNKDKNSLLNLVLFWVSGMVAILTIVSTVFGAWAIKLAIRALDVSIQSMDISFRGLDLAIAQACADPEAAAKLTQYCHPP